MSLSLPTLIALRRALIALLKSIDQALLEGYGWSPRCKELTDRVE